MVDGHEPSNADSKLHPRLTVCGKKNTNTQGALSFVCTITFSADPRVIVKSGRDAEPRTYEDNPCAAAQADIFGGKGMLISEP